MDLFFFISIFTAISAFLCFLKIKCKFTIIELVGIVGTFVAVLLASGQIFLMVTPHFHNPLNDIKAKIWKSSQTTGCFLTLEIKNQSLKYLENMRYGWSKLPADTWAAPANIKFEQVDKFYLVTNTFIVSNKFNLAPDETIKQRVVMPVCKTDDIAWINWENNKKKVDRTDRK